jgi:hypothetical protein
MHMTAQDGTPGFARDIRPLFRESDRESMEFAFDLWNVVDVRANAQGILERLTDGSMPCDEPWPDEQIALFDRWIAAGMPD